jgi:hypothetical protein
VAFTTTKDWERSWLRRNFVKKEQITTTQIYTRIVVRLIPARRASVKGLTFRDSYSNYQPMRMRKTRTGKTQSRLPSQTWVLEPPLVICPCRRHRLLSPNVAPPLVPVRATQTLPVKHTSPPAFQFGHLLRPISTRLVCLKFSHLALL